MQLRISAKRLVVGAMTAAVIAAGCSSSATPAPSGAFKLHLQLTPSHVSVAIAADQGFLKGIDLSYELVGYGESSQLFHAGNDPIGNEAPWEAAVYQVPAKAGATADYTQGKDIVYFGTAEANNFVAGIIIRATDAGKYKTLADLKGMKIGIPGAGTGTFAAFLTLAKGLANLDAKKDFTLVEGDPGALEGLLQKNSIEAFITFTAPTAHALANPAYKMIYNITDTWKTLNGAALPINGWIADSSWLDGHLDLAKNFISGVDQGLEYLKTHLDLHHAGGKYEKFAQGEGVLVSPETTTAVDKMIVDGYFYLSAKTYTKAWADSVYKFIQMGQGALLDTVPTQDHVFYAKTQY